MSLPLLIFDFDGTLVETFPQAMEVFNLLAPIHHFRPILDRELARTQATKEFFKAQGITMWKLTRFVRDFQEEMRKRAQEIKAVPDLPAALRAFHERGYRLGILSSNAEDHIRERLTAFEVAACFEFISSYPKLFGKARMLRKISKRLGIRKPDIVYIGDEFRDMAAARKAGVQAVAVTWGYHAESLLRQTEPHAVVHTPAELLEWILRLPA